jgi:uncharacterized membrane protein YeaQ/YmgE (transglycosylase-associated protein family)
LPSVTGVVTAIPRGIVVGVLGGLPVPGKQSIGMVLTILVGMVAFIGTAIARAIGFPTVTSGIDWLVVLVQSSSPRFVRRPRALCGGR